MADDRWLRIRQLFDAGVDLEPAERSAFLDAACADDAELRAEVEQLLTSFRRSADFLETPHGNVVPGDLEGRRLGAYELGPLIGAGGMGEVYRARDTRLERTVAVKVRVDRFLDSPGRRDQFAREARAISALNHPRICHLHDVGRDDAIEFLVMEYVEGEAITDYCRRGRLSLDQRLSVFRSVCEAVHYAHQNLVIHRDLKPANILVGADGQPKLLDFGIAKLLDATSRGELTATQSPLLTPDYASPEQVRGETVTTAADIYALGIVLYELLADRRPYVMRTSSLEDMVRTICETEPAPPSALVRDGEDPSRGRRLRGDLDTIVLKALRKEPERRYLSAQALADDIQRYLDGQPVEARGDALSYRLSKFVARHRGAALLASLFLISLLAAMTLIVRQSQIAEVQRQRAERRFTDVRKLAGSFLFEFHDAIKLLPGATRARQLVTTRALEYLDSLAEESTGDATLRAELARAYKQVADIQGGFREANLGDLGGALTSYQKALALQEGLASASADPATRKDLARTLAGLGDVQLMMRDVPAAAASFRRALAIQEGLADAGGTREEQREIAVSHYRIADALTEIRDTDGAEQNLQRAIGILESLATDTADRESRHALARSYKRLGMLRAVLGDTAANLFMEQQALRLVDALAAADPLNMTIRNEVAMAHIEVGRAEIRLGRFADALNSLRQAEAISVAMAEADKDNAQARWSHGLELNLIGVIFTAMQREADAIAAHLQASTLLEDVARADPSNENYQYNVANTYQLIADAYVARARGHAPPDARAKAWADARSWYRRSAEAFEAMRRRGPLVGGFAADAERVATGLALAEREAVSTLR